MVVKRQMRKKPVEDEDVNVTPLLDIVFIMLIFFIVTSTFVKLPGQEIDKVETLAGEKLRLVSVIIAVNADNEIWIDGEQFELSEVREKVQEMRRDTPKGEISIQVSQESEAGIVIDLIQEVNQATDSQANISTVET